MNEDNPNVYLVDIRDELMTIAPDEDPNGAFECAWEWWKDHCTRRKMKIHQFFYDAMNRGWLKKADAELFCIFLNKDHFWRCLY